MKNGNKTQPPLPYGNEGCVNITTKYDRRSDYHLGTADIYNVSLKLLE